MPRRFAGGVAIALAIASLTLAAGCQSASAPRQSAAKSSGDSGFYGEQRVKETLTAYSEAVADHCAVAGGGSIGCFQQTLLTSFAAESAATARECRLDMDYDPFFDCVMFGSTAEMILRNLGDAASKQMDWADPRGSFDTAIHLVGERVKAVCPTEYKSCVGIEMARMLGLEAVAGERCAAPDGYSLGECLARALLIEQFETATRNVGTVESAIVQPVTFG
jgi:hypothetical protein